MDLQHVVLKTFALLQTEWNVAQSQELLATLKPTHVIVRARQNDYYLFTVQEGRNRLAHAPKTASIQDALDLHEWNTTPLFDIRANAEHIPDQCIISEDGRLVGFFDASVSPGTARVLRGKAEQQELIGTTRRLLIAEFPDQVALNEVTSLLISLSPSRAAIGSLSLEELPVGTTIDIVVQTQRGFALEGRREGSLTITDAQETLPLQFKLRSTALGPGHMRVLALRNGVALGAMTLTPTVIETSEDIESIFSPQNHEQSLAAVSVRQPDLALLIEETRVEGQRAFVVRITASNPTLDLNLAKFGPIPFQIDPGQYFQEFYKDIEDFAVGTPMDRAITSQKLADKGNVLFRTLFPPEARQKLWSLKDQITSVLVQSEEPWIPWELCKLSGRDNGKIVEGPFLCEAFSMTRWIPGIGFKPVLQLRNMAVVVPNDSGLPFASSERDYLLSLAQSTRQMTSIPARFLDLHSALASGQYDGWHFTGHGVYRSSDPNRSAILLENHERLTPENLVGVVTNLGVSQPLVFLNACQIGRSDLSLTDIGGWARQFLTAGAGAFIGAYWSVYDQPACDFAKEIYSRLLAGKPIGKAVQEARLVIKATGDPTWLAYTVFADPLATVQV